MKPDLETCEEPTVEEVGSTDAGVGGAWRQAQLEHFRTMLERGAVEKARAWVQELARRWPDDEEVGHYVRVLALPQVSVRPGHRGPSRQSERAWLREQARGYPGQWLAVLADRLIAADVDLDVVLATVRATPGAERALLHFQPGSQE